MSSTFSIRIHGLPSGPPLLSSFNILKTATTMIGIHKIIAGFSILKIKTVLALLYTGKFNLLD
ncbi:MAG: hypothetical protein CMF93_01440 [Candidatus Marinimicrobia bacterium]|nr:hypothetical protein [Candidatus Neomarinimicrobiota bacterium]